jgi:hypothetical protein
VQPGQGEVDGEEVVVAGQVPQWKWWLYSKYLTTRKTEPEQDRRPHVDPEGPEAARISDAQAITMVTEDEIRTIVFNVASGTSRIVSPRGQLGAPSGSGCSSRTALRTA